MNYQQVNPNYLYGYLPSDIEGVEDLAGLALDMRWSWNHAADTLWEELDAELWQLTHNPWIVLQTVSRERLSEKLNDAAFRARATDLVRQKNEAVSQAAWFDLHHQEAELTTVAYFSMEFMLSEALPIYGGGLGNVAGDQLKSASDLGVPVVGIGLLYQQGYFRQEIDAYGNQRALFPYNDPGQLPVMPLRLPNGEWLRLKISLSGQTVWLRTWQVQVGRNKLYLLDSNDAANLPSHRNITNELYGGGSDMRIQQEIILGIGGWRLLKALSIKPKVCHMNEGHAAFVVLERAKDLMHENGLTFEEAVAVTRAGNLFTTHTAVAAGFDFFSPALMWQFFGSYAKDELGISFNELMAMGRIDATNYSESFNMANLAIRGSGAVNGVSSLHGEVSRSLFKYLFPRWDIPEVPVGSVTNGVHMASWDSEFADELWTEACGKERWRGSLENVTENIFKATEAQLWRMRNKSRGRLVNFVRSRLVKQLTLTGQSPELVENAGRVFDPAILTLGFARRFVPYKRPNLLLYDEERLVRILTDKNKPVQLVIAGKASPFDEAGKWLVRQWVQFIERRNMYNHVVFLSDYDMFLTENLVQGVDVWLNTPRRPWEACGTSGMKVLVNGGLNLSELDGWWAEAYEPEAGWALGDGREHGDDPAWDAAEASALYDILETQVIPEFYCRDENGIPQKWAEMIRKSMATLTPRFSANRTVREYTEKYYLPAAVNYKKRAAGGGVEGQRQVKMRQLLRNSWDEIKFGMIDIEEIANGYHFSAKIFFNGIEPGKIKVQLFANGLNDGLPEKITMQTDMSIDNAGFHQYVCDVITSRSSSDYTVRVIPSETDIAVPLENNLICWQR